MCQHNFRFQFKRCASISIRSLYSYTDQDFSTHLGFPFLDAVALMRTLIPFWFPKNVTELEMKTIGYSILINYLWTPTDWNGY